MTGTVSHPEYPHSSSGFTLLELIIGATLLLAVGALSVAVIGNQRAGTLDTEAEIIASRLSNAQSRAISAVSGSGWGIHFHNATATAPYYALFRGAAYTTSTITYVLPSSITFDSPSSGNSTDIVFSKLSGTLTASTSITISLKSRPELTKTILISKQGLITIN